MGRPRTIQHGRTKYTQGCRCDVCCEAEAVYQKGRRHGVEEPVTDTSDRVVGANEAAVQAEIEGLANAETRPSTVQAALTVARVLDNKVAVAQHTGAAKELRALMDSLHKGGDARSGRLASVKKLAAQRAG
jgi:hypothetical protein